MSRRAPVLVVSLQSIQVDHLSGSRAETRAPILEGEQVLATQLFGADLPLPHLDPEGVAGDEPIERAAKLNIKVIEIKTHLTYIPKEIL